MRSSKTVGEPAAAEGQKKKPRRAAPSASARKPAPRATSPRTSRKKTAPAPVQQMPDQATIDAMVAEAAYYLAEKRHFAPGFEEQDWQAARDQIEAQLRAAKKPLE